MAVGAESRMNLFTTPRLKRLWGRALLGAGVVSTLADNSGNLLPHYRACCC